MHPKARTLTPPALAQLASFQSPDRQQMSRQLILAPMDIQCRGLPVHKCQPLVRLAAFSAPAWRRIPASECIRRQPGPSRCPTWSKQSCTALQQAAAMVAATTDESISKRMAALKQAGRGAFIPFLVAGDPDLDTTAEAILELDRAGADVIELGVPYSDPLADGPTIQAAATRALANGTTLDKVLAVVERVSPHIRAQLVMFTYYNPIMRRGAERFCQQAKAAGASGLLVPDIPLEETDDIRRIASAAGLELVMLVTPTTPEARMRAIAAVSQGFVYLVSVAGVTGQRQTNEARVEGLIQLLHSVTDKPVAVGFGVSGPEQARQLMAWGAEGVIVGSALVKALAAGATPAEGVRAVGELARKIRAAT